MAAASFPSWLISLAGASWDKARIVNQDGSIAYPVDSGVGQGCPAASVLFIIGINPLLVSLDRVLSCDCGEVLSAYADDIAMVLASPASLAPVAAEFAKFQAASALRINKKKTVFVPTIYQRPSYRRRRDEGHLSEHQLV